MDRKEEPQYFAPSQSSPSLSGEGPGHQTTAAHPPHLGGQLPMPSLFGGAPPGIPPAPGSIDHKTMLVRTFNDSLRELLAVLADRFPWKPQHPTGEAEEKKEPEKTEIAAEYANVYNAMLLDKDTTQYVTAFHEQTQAFSARIHSRDALLIANNEIGLFAQMKLDQYWPQLSALGQDRIWQRIITCLANATACAPFVRAPLLSRVSSKMQAHFAANGINPAQAWQNGDIFGLMSASKNVIQNDPECLEHIKQAMRGIDPKGDPMSALKNIQSMFPAGSGQSGMFDKIQQLGQAAAMMAARREKDDAEKAERKKKGKKARAREEEQEEQEEDAEREKEPDSEKGARDGADDLAEDGEHVEKEQEEELSESMREKLRIREEKRKEAEERAMDRTLQDIFSTIDQLQSANNILQCVRGN